MGSSCVAVHRVISTCSCDARRRPCAEVAATPPKATGTSTQWAVEGSTLSTHHITATLMFTPP